MPLSHLWINEIMNGKLEAEVKLNLTEYTNITCFAPAGKGEYL